MAAARGARSGLDEVGVEEEVDRGGSHLRDGAQRALGQTGGARRGQLTPGAAA